MGKNMNKVQTCGSKRIPCLRMKQGHTHTHTHQCAHTHTHISAHAHRCRCKRCCCCCKVASVVSDSVRPHRWQPTRLPRPWDSSDKNTGGGCHFLLQCMKVKSESKGAQSCPTLSNPMNWGLPGSSIHGIFQASTGVGCHCLLPGVKNWPANAGEQDIGVWSLGQEDPQK